MKRTMFSIILLNMIGCMLLAVILHFYNMGYASYIGAAAYGAVIGLSYSTILVITYKSWYKHRFFKNKTPID